MTLTPNLFIIGAPKCGTSSLFDWLGQHPQICPCKIKEPFVLINPNHPLSRQSNFVADGAEAYSRLFMPQDSTYPYRMEGTTHYLYDDHARNIISSMSDSRVIIVLREPSARVFSSFTYTLNNLARLESNLTFSKYLSLIKTQSSLFPVWCNNVGSAYVLEHDVLYSRYHVFLADWFKVIPRNRIFILLMEDLIADPQNAVSSIFSWLDLEHFSASLSLSSQKNRTENIRFRSIQSLARRTNSLLPMPRVIKNGLLKLYSLAQYRKGTTFSEDDKRSLEDLRMEFLEDNQLLARISGLDIAKWL